ncbi:hypothetical protein METP3_03196 [Methanosarcinales archaeon]|nr:hypothetical protein METP3_03196 [Methanosarcinales archaeon]
MKIAIFINTPAQLHFYKNMIRSFKNRNSKVFLLVRDYGETLQLLSEMDFEYYIFSRSPKSKSGKIINLPFDIFKAYRYLRNLKPDLVLGFGVYDVFTSHLLKVPCIVFNDSEPNVNNISYAIQYKLYTPFIDLMITPASFKKYFGSKQVRINSYKELSYLHPNYYLPSDDITDLLGIKRNESYTILRFNSFDAVHDFNVKGFSNEDKIKLVKSLEKYAKVFISSEAEVSSSLKKYVANFPKNRIHDILYHANLLVTDTQTMATEGAILGTPTIRCNTFAGNKDMSNFIELEQKYNLIFNYSNPDKAINKAIELIQKQNLKEEWKIKKEKLLKDKIDINAFMIRFIENYPQSFEEIKRNPEIQNMFK